MAVYNNLTHKFLQVNVNMVCMKMLHYGCLADLSATHLTYISFIHRLCAQLAHILDIQ